MCFPMDVRFKFRVACSEPDIETLERRRRGSSPVGSTVWRSICGRLRIASGRGIGCGWISPQPIFHDTTETPIGAATRAHRSPRHRPFITMWNGRRICSYRYCMRSLELSVEIEEWPRHKPLRISGYTFESVRVIVV